nr:RNA-directed DNA polymerase, eukaryota [Tanacetum cinerariifolium]
MSFSKRPENDAVCYTKPLDSLKGWNDRFFWVDAFACPASFAWNTSKSVPKDPIPKASAFNADHYATLVAHSAPFHKYPEPFLCLVGISRYYTLDENAYPVFLRADDEEMDLISFIRTDDPMKVRIAEREHGVDEPVLLETTVGRVVPLLPVAPARSSSELEASVDGLFGSGKQAEQGDSAGVGHGRGVVVQPITATSDAVVEDVAPLQPRHQKKRKTVVADASGPSYSPKKLREDHRAQGELSVAGNSRSTIQRLLAGAVLNAEVRGDPILTLPFFTSFVFATPKRADEGPTDFTAGLDLRTIGAPQRVEEGPRGGHLRDEKRRTRGMPSLFLLRSWDKFMGEVLSRAYIRIRLSSDVNLSHLFYADDAMFVGQWSDSNIGALVHVLKSFHQASGLKINMSKSKIMGIHVNNEKVNDAATTLGCLTLKTSFVYIGTKVGDNMSRVEAWKDIVEKVSSRLSR